MSIQRRFSRRGLLAGLSGSLAALPLLPLPSEAQDREFPKRLICVHTPNGTVMDQWWPGASDLSELSPILDPLAAYASRMIVMRGVDMDSAYKEPKPKDHWPDTMNALTGRQGIMNADQTSKIGGISIDQHIIDELPSETQFGSIHLGVHTQNNQRLSATGPDAHIPPISNPANAFDQLFSELDLDPFELAALRARRGSVLDTVASDLESLSTRFSGSYKDKVELHLDSIRAMEQSLQAGASGNCEAPTLGNANATDSDDYPILIGQQFDIVQHALSCDLARIATVQLGGRKLHPTWIGIDHSHHGISHGSEGVTASQDQRTAWLVEIENWYAQQFASLLDRLDAVPEGDGTLLDHSLVVWLHEQSNGANHNRRNMPYVIAGGLHGSIEMGRRLDFSGVPHNRLLTSLAQAMGVPTEQFGDPQFGSAPLADFYAM